MSETLKQETQDRPITINGENMLIQCRWDSSVDDWVITEHGHETITRLKIEKLECDRNRWRSVAEQLEKFARFQKENGAVGPVGERLMNEGLSAFDSLRKEATGE
jgi:hypothetical protein